MYAFLYKNINLSICRWVDVYMYKCFIKPTRFIHNYFLGDHIIVPQKRVIMQLKLVLFWNTNLPPLFFKYNYLFVPIQKSVVHKSF